MLMGQGGSLGDATGSFWSAGWLVCAVKSGPLTLDALGVERGKRGTTKSLRLHEEWQHMNRRALLMAMRMTFGLLALTAIGRQFVIQVQSGFSIVNFFSFFTNLSNIFAAVVLLRGAAFIQSRRGRSTAVRSVPVGRSTSLCAPRPRSRPRRMGGHREGDGHGRPPHGAALPVAARILRSCLTPSRPPGRQCVDGRDAL